jgi:flagellar biosynthesis/type III secretory pathway M-ring protein FliF/YscJ
VAAGATGDAAADAANQALALAAGKDAAAALAAGEARPAILIAPRQPTETVVLHERTSPVRDQVVALMQQRPEAATRVLRNWMRQD